ncbi:MAG: DUF167 domain-containing protein [Gemmatimonadales bacterium]
MRNGKREAGSGKRESRAPDRPRAPRTILAVQVQPRARRTEIVGWHGDAIKVRVAAPPVDDRANRILVRFIAERLGLERSAVYIRSGRNSRRKYVVVHGLARAVVLGKLGLKLQKD